MGFCKNCWVHIETKTCWMLLVSMRIFLSKELVFYHSNRGQNKFPKRAPQPTLNKELWMVWQKDPFLRNWGELLLYIIFIRCNNWMFMFIQISTHVCRAKLEGPKFKFNVYFFQYFISQLFFLFYFTDNQSLQPAPGKYIKHYSGWKPDYTGNVSHMARVLHIICGSAR